MSKQSVQNVSQYLTALSRGVRGQAEFSPVGAKTACSRAREETACRKTERGEAGDIFVPVKKEKRDDCARCTLPHGQIASQRIGALPVESANHRHEAASQKDCARDIQAQRDGRGSGFDFHLVSICRRACINARTPSRSGKLRYDARITANSFN